MVVFGSLISILLVWLLTVILTSSSSSNQVITDYKLSHAETTSEMNSSIQAVVGSVEVLDVTVTGQLCSLKDDMVDVKTSNQNTMVAVRDLIRSLENQGVIAKRHRDSSILLASDFGE